MSDTSDSAFQFEISLSVLNHLGRNLYRNFITVLGEAISNSWDADAKNVWITIDREKSTFAIKDDGKGMNSDDFQKKFLKIGYSKRADGETKTKSARPFIGAKGIGKLALLSCANRISIFSKTADTDYTGGTIDNGGLDDAIKNDLIPQDYPLEDLNFELIDALKEGHDKGTIIVFEETKEQLRNSIAHIKKLLAMSFRFTLLDKEFSIYVNGEEVGINDLQGLIDSSEFLWLINQFEDDYIQELKSLKSDANTLTTTLAVKGFIASVEKPRHLKITGTDERATIDLFVNGRIREKNILRHIPTQRIIESYIYGQIHFDSMDQIGVDPFTSSREGVVEDDENFQALLEYLKKEALPPIMDEWDELRLARGDTGDDENTKRKSKKDRKARDLYAAAKEEYEPEPDDPNKDQVDTWLSELRPDAEFNLSAYADCFLSENLVRKYIASQGIEPGTGAKGRAKQWKDREAVRKGEANISYPIRKTEDDLNYLDMNDLAYTAEGSKGKTSTQSLWTDAINYRPVRNVVGHTGLLTKNAKNHLSLTFENIKGRVRSLISGK
jgi:hypothetical protein